MPRLRVVLNADDIVLTGTDRLSIGDEHWKVSDLRGGHARRGPSPPARRRTVRRGRMSR